MPDLGKYAFEVLTSYGVSIVLILGLLVVTLRKGRAARDALAEAETEAGDRRDG